MILTPHLFSATILVSLIILYIFELQLHVMLDLPVAYEAGDQIGENV